MNHLDFMRFKEQARRFVFDYTENSPALNRGDSLTEDAIHEVLDDLRKEYSSQAEGIRNEGASQREDAEKECYTLRQQLNKEREIISKYRTALREFLKPLIEAGIVELKLEL